MEIYTAKTLARAARALKDLDAEELRLDWIDVLERYSAGESLQDIATDYVVRETQLRRHMTADPVRAEQWHQAMANRAWHAADRAIEVAEKLQPKWELVEEEDFETGEIVKHRRRYIPGATEVTAAKVLIDTLRWTATKLAPEVFGERMKAELDVRISHEQALREIIDAEVGEHGA